MNEEDLEKLKSILREEFSDYYEFAGGKNYRYHHLVSVHRYARELMEKDEVTGKDVDPEVVEVAALFHDIGRSEDIEDGYLNPIEEHEGHDEKGAEIVGEYIREFVDSEQLEKIQNVIRNHHSEPETVEGKIVQDADLLYKYGVHDLWRMFHYAAEVEGTLEEAIEYFREELRQRQEEGLEEFHFEVSREVAKKRLASRKNAFREMEEEIMGDDI